MAIEFKKSFDKGEILGPELNEFINNALSTVCKLERIKGGYPHDIEVKFKKKVTLKVIIS